MAKPGKLIKAKTKEEVTRPVRYYRYDVFILIVCEDEKTEPYYFQQFKQLFPQETVFIREIGTGKKPKGIVEQTITERESFSEEAKKDVDEVWVVFDKDDEGNNATTSQSFNQAWSLAEKENIKIAFSNEVFELWLLLHFIELDAGKPIARNDIYGKLEAAIRAFDEHKLFIYEHGKIEVVDIVFQKGDEDQAITRAKKLSKHHSNINNSPINSNPSTSVNRLVTHLRDLILYYSYTPGK